MEKVSVWNEEILKTLMEGEYRYPHNLLGMHKLDGEKRLLIRVLCPQAKRVVAIGLEDETKRYAMEGKAQNGYFEYVINDEEDIFLYKLECEDESGHAWSYIDPYQFESTVRSEDLYLFGIGKDYEIYRKMGAHFMTVQGVEGVRFLLWAPHAERVSIIGSCNNWDGRRHMMRYIESHGVWELFIPGLVQGDTYKYEILTSKGVLLTKTDPYANYYEKRPQNASIIFNDEDYNWEDNRWMNIRKEKQPCKEAMSIYEIHIGSWKRHLDGTQYSYEESAKALVSYIKEMGYTHVELMGIIEHPFDGSWGYQVTGYYAPTSRYGNPDEFKYFVDLLHQNGIGVILDWVPAHFPKDAFALEKFDGEALYEKNDERQACHPHWGTLIFDYGKPQVSLFLIGSALSWLEKYHIDGLRVDAVASMLYLDYGRGWDYVRNKFGGNENLEAIEFLKHLNEVAYARVPGTMMIAEESTAWPKVSYPVAGGGLGFGFKWNMGWMNDFLSYMSTPADYRKQEHGKITFSLMYAFSENYVQVLSHDEVVHEKQCMLYKMPGTMEEKYANLKVAYGYLFVHPGKKMLFMGNELAVKKEWNEESQLEWELLKDPNHRGVQAFVKALNHLYTSEKALWDMNDGYDNFEWIDCENAEQKTLAFVRKGTNCTEDLVVAINFSDVAYEKYRIGVPHSGSYIELLNSDAKAFSGLNRTNSKVIKAEMMPWHGRAQSMEIKLPAFSICVFKVKKIMTPEELEKGIKKEKKKMIKDTKIMVKETGENLLEQISSVKAMEVKKAKTKKAKSSEKVVATSNKISKDKICKKNGSNL
ncbi:MAG: 1,4-alpha-glucan branching protein GlgB [Cellulosilyticum sp.]|nr:1,4-alpha-glucan branching protein GlgB [Cellulosilyticum sp.]